MPDTGECTAAQGSHWPIGWPRFEDKEFIGTAGNARPLDQALQHATTEMLRWLQEGYGLDAVAAFPDVETHLAFEDRLPQRRRLF